MGYFPFFPVYYWPNQAGAVAVPVDITGILETRVFLVLTSDVTIKNRVNTRIYPVVMPQEVVLPAISYQRVSSSPENTLEGFTNLENADVVVNSWARNYDEAKVLAAEVHAAMDAARLFRCVLTNELDGYDPDISLYVVSQNYSCWNTEA